MTPKKIVGFIIFTLIAFGSAGAGSWYILFKHHNEYRNYLALMLMLFVFSLYGHWLATGLTNPVRWFLFYKAYVVCIIFAAFILLLIGSIYGFVFYMAVAMIPPTVITASILEYLKKRRDESAIFTDADLTEVSKKQSKRKCYKCKRPMTKIKGINPLGYKQIRYKCECDVSKSVKND